MSRERRIKFNEKTVEFLKPINIWMLDKVHLALEEIKSTGTKEVQLTLNFTELQAVRRMLVLDDMFTELCRDNILEGMEFRRSQHAKEEEAEGNSAANHLGAQAYNSSEEQR